jgi:hypothetical protein
MDLPGKRKVIVIVVFTLGVSLVTIVEWLSVR